MPLLEQVRDVQTKTLGPDHPDTLHTLHNLARAYGEAERRPEAIRLLERVRDAAVRTLGATTRIPWSPSPAWLRCTSTGKRPEAIRLLESVRDVRPSRPGPTTRTACPPSTTWPRHTGTPAGCRRRSGCSSRWGGPRGPRRSGPTTRTPWSPSTTLPGRTGPPTGCRRRSGCTRKSFPRPVATSGRPSPPTVFATHGWAATLGQAGLTAREAEARTDLLTVERTLYLATTTTGVVPGVPRVKPAEGRQTRRGRAAPPRVPGHPREEGARRLVDVQHAVDARRGAVGPEEVRRRRAAAAEGLRGDEAAGEDRSRRGVRPASPRRSTG